MSDQPTQPAEWASGGSADIVEPSAGKKLLGYEPAELPPAQHKNWILNTVYLWTLWLFEGILQRSSLTDRTPILQTCDRNARPRHYLGPEGYWMGTVMQDENRWYVNSGSDVADNTKISPHDMRVRDTGAGVTARVLRASATSPVHGGPALRLRIGIGISAQTTSVGYGQGANYQPVGNLDNTVAVAEWPMHADRDQEVAVFAGLQSDGYINGAGGVEGGGGVDYAHFRSDHNSPSTETTWFCVCGNNGVDTAVNSSVPIVSTEFNIFRIELHGANTPKGVANTTSAVCLFFVNGVLVATITDANVPDSIATLGLGAHINSVAGASGESDLLVGTMKLAWNGLLNPNVPA